MDENKQKEFRFGNERFGGFYRPGEFELNLPPELSREEFEEMFKSRMEALYNFKNDLEEDYEIKSKKERLKPLSIRVKPHTKEFFKNASRLSAREVLELYEDFNNGSEAFINSLLEEEKQLKGELEELQEKLHNTLLFKDKLKDLKPEKPTESDDDKLMMLEEKYPKSDINVIGNENSQHVAQDIIEDIQVYNTIEISVKYLEYIKIVVYTNKTPVIYYFKNNYSADDFESLSDEIRDYCDNNEIEFKIINDGGQ